MNDAHLVELANRLLSDPDYSGGGKPIPFRVSPDEAVALIRRIVETIDAGVSLRAEKAAAAGLRVACGPGCTACCEQPILVWLPQVLLVVEWLLRPENATARAGFQARYPAWRTAVGESCDAIADASAGGDLDAYRAAHLEGWRRRVLCVFNQGDLCTIYPVRPITCRDHHATGTSELCIVDAPSGRQPRRAAFAPLDDYVGRCRAIAGALHHALGGTPNRPLLLGEAVAVELAARDEHAR